MKTTTTLAAFVLLGAIIGGSAALAQATGEKNSGAGVPSGPAVSTPPRNPDLGPALQPPTGLQNQAQSNEDEFFNHHPGMMGMMDRGFGHHGWPQGRGARSSTMMRIIFSLMDANGDGKLTLEEWQAAHERIFKAMDANHDGSVTLEEMQNFMRGTSSPTGPQQ